MPTDQLQAKIVRIGTVRFSREDNVHIIDGWEFDCENKNIPPLSVDDDGTARLCGYTQKELFEITQRPDEWL